MNDNKHIGDRLCVSVLEVLWVALIVECHLVYQTNIPNGAFVPDPCQKGELWGGVGHKNPKGRGPRNPFGTDYRETADWGKLCQKDSDGDGLINGQELGDPNCSWKKGDPNPAYENLSHPGVCEPLDSPLCIGRNDWLSCETNKTFQCDGISDADTLNISLRLQDESVPAQETTYVCKIFDLPFNESYDVFAAEPIIGNNRVLHHMLLYGCATKMQNDGDGSLFDCFMTEQTHCKELLGAFGAWERGVSELCLNSELGIRIGTQGYPSLMIQYHWTNIDMAHGLTDSSGLKLYYTPKLRTYRTGILMIGQISLDIPPGHRSTSFSGGCVEDCSRHRIKNDVYITGAFNHMHYLGRRQTVEVFRDGKLLKLVSDEVDYDYNNPAFYKLDEPFLLKPGDNLTTTCTFDSSKKNETVKFGLGTGDEMCFAFLRFYPLESLPLNEGGCSTWKSVPLCKIYTRDIYTIQNCTIKLFFKEEVKKTGGLIEKTLEKCKTDERCTTECRTAREAALAHPCLQNDIGDYVKKELLDRSDEERYFIEVLRSVCDAIDDCNTKGDNQCDPHCRSCAVKDLGPKSAAEGLAQNRLAATVMMFLLIATMPQI